MNLLYIFGSNAKTIESELNDRNIIVTGVRITDIFNLIAWYVENDLFQPADDAIVSNPLFRFYIDQNIDRGISVAFMYAIRELDNIEPVERTGVNRHREMTEDGQVVDPITMEEYPERPIVIGGRHYSTATASRLVSSDEPRDPFTNIRLSVNEINRIRSEIYTSSMDSMRNDYSPQLARIRSTPVTSIRTPKRLFQDVFDTPPPSRQIYCDHCQSFRSAAAPNSLESESLNRYTSPQPTRTLKATIKKGPPSVKRR